jgi:putative transposase
VSNGARVKVACTELGIGPRTLERWRQRDGGADLRCGPKTEPANKLSAAERRKVLETMNSPEYADLPPNQIVPKLCDRGEYLCSESTMYRVLKEENQLARRGREKEPQPRQPVLRVATRPNQIWSWDISYLRSPVAGRWYYLYLVVDIWSRKITGWAVHSEERGDHASALIRRAARAEQVRVDELTLHSDNGGPMKGSTMLATLTKLGITPSFTRPSVCDDNPFSEALFRTLKYRPEYPSGPFDSLDAARRWVAAFVHWYNHEHQHSGIQYVSPIDRHEGRSEAILEARRAVYEAARARHPERWGSRDTRDWTAPQRVCVRARRDGGRGGQRVVNEGLILDRDTGFAIGADGRVTKSGLLFDSRAGVEIDAAGEVREPSDDEGRS